MRFRIKLFNTLQTFLKHKNYISICLSIECNLFLTIVNFVFDLISAFPKIALKMELIGDVLKSIGLIENNILQIVFKDEITVDEFMVDLIYSEIDQYISTINIRKLLVIGTHTKITPKARLLIVENNAQRKDKIIGEAIIVHSFAQKLSANFYILFLGNIYPTQFFTNLKLAKEWLTNLPK